MKLNDEQQSIVNATDKKIVVLAGAGSGKTHTLIARISHLIKDAYVNPNSMLVLTFTRAAAGEFSARFALENPNEIHPNFSTFDAFCYNLVVYNTEIRNYLGYENIPNIVDDAKQKQLIAQAIHQSKCKLPKSKCTLNYKPTNPFETFQHKLFMKTYDRLLKSSNSITFEALATAIADLFETNNKLIKPYLEKYKYIFVDEFQDTDPNQWRFVNSFKYSNIMVIGDIRQAIYGFRGADSTIMKNIINSGEYREYTLSTNYRSTNQICEFSNSILDKYNDDFGLKLNGLSDGPDVKRLEKNELLYTMLKDMEEKTIAVLYRTNKEVEDALYTFRSNNMFPNYKIQDNQVLKVMAALDDEYLEKYLISTMSVSNQNLLTDLIYMNRNSKDEFNALNDFIKPRCKYQLDELHEYKNSKQYKELKAKYDSKQFSIEDIKQSINAEKSNTYVGTIHSVKGLEFDTVYVCGVGGRHFNPFKNEELMNLYYVACTRAKRELYIVNG